MIYITGDMHGERARFSAMADSGALPKKGDTLIVCGDFGFLFAADAAENAFLDSLEQLPYDICFCDGNHENFPALFACPEQTRYGGRVHRIRRNVFHLMRGEIFEMEGNRFFVMGGAFSTDRFVRTVGRSYWEEELPCNAEYRAAIQNLAGVGNKVDYIVTHTAPREIIRMMGHYPDPCDGELTGFFDWIAHEVQFRRWFFGHWHTDREIAGRFRALWFDTVRVPRSPEEKNKEISQPC